MFGVMFGVLIVLQSLCPARASVPEYGTIASRTADNHGRGAYQIEQEVTLKKEAETYVIKETWTVLGESNMRVSLEGRGPLRGLAQGVIVYDGGTRAFAEAGQSVRSARLGEDWVEPLFHFRYSKWFRNRLVQLRVTPAESLEDRPPLNAEGDPGYVRPGFLRLSRAGGAVCYAVGLPPDVSAGPAVWIEQDEFVLRKYRAANGATVRADDYFKEGTFHVPRKRSYTFGGFEVQVQTLGVKSLGKLANTDPRFRASALSPQRDALKLPDVDGLREFYSRFR